MLNNIFCPNGIQSLKIITTLAKKEFGDKIGNPCTYIELKKTLIKI